jgi:hypothetical protein
MKNLRWLAVAFLFLIPHQAALGSGEQACCGALGNAGPWLGGVHPSLCIRGATCSSASHSQVAVTFFDGPASCPAGSYDCVVAAYNQCCAYDCSYEPECGASSPSPSCCSGYCGSGSAKPGSCSPPVQARGCCLEKEIRVPSALSDATGEWIISYGYKVK